jgi:hypothetical protein
VELDLNSPIHLQGVYMTPLLTDLKQISLQEFGVENAFQEHRFRSGLTYMRTKSRADQVQRMSAATGSGTFCRHISCRKKHKD